MLWDEQGKNSHKSKIGGYNTLADAHGSGTPSGSKAQIAKQLINAEGQRAGASKGSGNGGSETLRDALMNFMCRSSGRVPEQESFTSIGATSDGRRSGTDSKTSRSKDLRCCDSSFAF